MANEAYLDLLEIEASVLSPVSSRMPICDLSLTDRRATMNVRVAVLKNRYLKLTFALDLGGRILEIEDYRFGTSVIRMPSNLDCIPGGARGAMICHGIELVCGSHKASSLGPVEFELIEDRLVLHELIPGANLSVVKTWSLHEDYAAAKCEVRLYNRSLNHPAPQTCTLIAHEFTEFRTGANSWVAFNAETKGVIGVEWRESGFDSSEHSALTRAMGGELKPFSTDAFEFFLIPGQAQTLPYLRDGILVELTEAEMNVRSSAPMPEVAVEFAGTETYAATFAVSPENAESLAFPEPPRSVALRIGERSILLSDEPLAAQSALLETSSRAAAWMNLVPKLGIEATMNALNSAADHPLAWWVLATQNRFEEGDGSLLNGHYLNPLEPALRAESFLRQPQAQGKEPNPLLKPIANHPEAMIDVACLMLTLGMHEDAARFMDECLRHRNEPLIRYVMAWHLLQHSRMHTEAAAHIQAVESLAVERPYPWREFEHNIGVDLMKAFPESKRLREVYAC